MKSLFIFFLFLLSAGWSNAQKVSSKSFERLLQTMLSHDVNEVTVSEVKNIKNPLFLDARESNEYLVSHLPGAIWVGYENFQDSIVNKLNKNQPIIVYCSIGYRSEKITERLTNKGFTKVYNLYGGIFEWYNQGKPLVNIQHQPIDTVHPYSALWGIWLKKK